MKFPQNKAITIIVVCTIGLLSIGIPFVFPYLKTAFAQSGKQSKNISEKTNTHFNREKIQEIIANDSLNRKQKAQMANNMGCQLMKKFRYREAIEYFEFAIDYDNTFIATHHNLACALIKEDVDCGKLKAFKELLFEIRLDPSLREAISNDTALMPLRLTKAFTVLHNGFPQNDSLLRIMLVGRWYKMNKRPFEPDIHFGSNTKGTFNRIDKTGKIETTDFSYYVLDRIITINYLDDSGNTFNRKLQIDYDEDRMIVIRDIDGFDRWSEFNECDQ